MKTNKKQVFLKTADNNREYCCECRKYHRRPTWAPGRPCGYWIGKPAFSK